MGALASSCPWLGRLAEPVVTARVLVVAAHPDDETIGAGALIARSTDVHVCLVTDGAPRDASRWPQGLRVESREEYVSLRATELRHALADAGVVGERVHQLGIPDGEAIDHVAVIVPALLQLLETVVPDIVLTHAYEGGHVDHDATAVAVHAALALRGRGHAHEMALYHARGGDIAVHDFQPSGTTVRPVRLDARAAAVKAAMLARYTSQQVHRRYFGTEVERFRCAPAYDFGRSPDPSNTLLYEQGHANIDGDQWRTRAVAALEAMGLSSSPSSNRTPVESPSAALPGSGGAAVSVIVRSSGRPTLHAALQSIADQLHRPIEIVLVDVAGEGEPKWSPPAGVSLTRRPAAGFDRARAANAGLMAASGQYVAFLDDDDWFHPTHLQALVAALAASPETRVAYAAVEAVEHPEGAPPVRRWVFDRPYDPIALLCENYIPLNAILVPRSMIDEGCRFDEALAVYEDWDFLIGLSRRTRFLAVPGIGAVYRWPPGSGVNDPARTAGDEDYIIGKWRSAVTAGEYAAVVRRGVEQTEIRTGHEAAAAGMRQHIGEQDAALARLGALSRAQDEQLAELRAHLAVQDRELDQLRDRVSTQQDELDDLRPRLATQQDELDELRPRLATQQDELDDLRPRLAAQRLEIAGIQEAAAARTAQVIALRDGADARRAEAERRVAELLASRSWRLTRPLRAAGAPFVRPAPPPEPVGAGRPRHQRGVRGYIIGWKLRLASGSDRSRRLVPIVESLEVLLSHGPREVVRRARRRLGTRRIVPPLPAAAAAPSPEMRPRVTLPALEPGPGTVSIVIPVLNNTTVTYDCLAALSAQTAAGRYEVIVIDNASGHDTRAMLASVDGLRVIRNDENAGFVEACNQGAAAARGEYVLFLNNDTVVLPGWLEPLVETMAACPDVGAVGARLLFPDGRLQEAGNIIWSDGQGWNYGKFGDPDAPEFGYVREVDYCSGACLLVKRSTFAELGGFDLRYAPAYYEDTDFCFRLREHGYRVLYQPASRIVHLEGATAGRDESTGFKQHQLHNREKFRARHAAALSRQHPHDPGLVQLARERRAGRRILVVDHMVPHHDQDSGSLRMDTILRMLAQLGHAVTLLPDNLAAVEPYTGRLQQCGIEVLYGPLAPGSWLAEHISRFDIVILCRAYFAAKHLPAVRASPRRPFIVFDTVDLHHLREERLAALAGDERVMAHARKTREVELAVSEAVDLVWVTSTHEAEVLADYRLQTTVEVMPNVHDVRADTPGFDARRDLLFIGGFAHPPNIDAVLYFADQVLPLVNAALPEVRLHVVGSNVPPEIRRLESSRIRVLGYVPDVEPIFDACRLSVAPLRYGAGVKGKITQSLAWGLPVVTTPTGSEGLDVIDGIHLAVASDAAEMAKRIVEVYTDRGLWERLAHNGRTHLAERFGIEAVRKKLEATILRADQPASDRL